jgi:lipopolysaccharide export system protein LptA
VIRHAALWLVFPAMLAAQERQTCTWNSQRQANVRAANGQYNTFLGGNVVMRCPNRQLTLRSDSLEAYGDEGRVFAIGNVRYSEPRLDVDSDYLTYFQTDERIVANGNVHARHPNGSSMRGPVAEYFRAIPSSRPIPRLVAAGRPTFTLVQRDSAGKPSPPMTVQANTVTMVGDSLVYAGGAVNVSREQITARGDSMALDAEREVVVMMRQPSIEGKRGRPFTLAGDVLELSSRQRELERVLARGRGRATSQDLTLTSDSIDLRVANDLLQRAFAWGPSRATAFSPTQRITADSIDVLMPAQRVQEMRAIRGALAEGKPDSIRFRADTMDWLRGDTIIARFDTTAGGDTTRTARIRELVALGTAKSYYHLAPADTAMRRPAINYVLGREIVVSFQNQQVARVTVTDQAAGVYAEPRPETRVDTSATRRPSTQTRPPQPRPASPVPPRPSPR